MFKHKFTYLDLMTSSVEENIGWGGLPEPDRLKFLRPPGIFNSEKNNFMLDKQQGSQHKECVCNWALPCTSLRNKDGEFRLDSKFAQLFYVLYSHSKLKH